MDSRQIASAGIHPIELCIYSVLSSNLEAIYQAINELRESQALLVMKLNQVRSSFQEEQEILREEGSLKEELARLHVLKRRVDKIVETYSALATKCKKL
ncbi:Snn1p Ecym_5369 [Eremothecium cymbalariae DBVPG|uniref:Biogenesis of lysosome-related organelles complex 1 subunit SNN1 n=1 Tax=Eremothecium cymbalariae (strain CBS 270.75 / DBVPG 7215 / KCTC 17166 / NRRL Y-17582) TaxID=931890 RepID=I6NDI3_ERECY|nr:hypothetical protein Ecym_5369 [Eremothecium cymbalariae DBVPG\